MITELVIRDLHPDHWAHPADKAVVEDFAGLFTTEVRYRLNGTLTARLFTHEAHAQLFAKQLLTGDVE